MSIKKKKKENKPKYYSQFTGDLVPTIDPKQMIETIAPNGGQYLTFLLTATHPIVSQITNILVSSNSSLTISSVEAVLNPSQQRLFFGLIEKSETRLKDPIFQSDLGGEVDVAQRQSTLEWLNQADFLLKHNRNILIAQLFHGTTSEAARNICVTGFADLSKLDQGWYGRAVYLTDSPQYALEYCVSKPDPCIIVTKSIIFNPFPISPNDTLSSDPSQFRFYGKGHHKNFWCNVARVKKYGPLDYRPPTPGSSPEATEFAVFDENHLLPSILIHLKRKLSPTSMPTIPQKDYLKMTIDEVVEWIKALKLSEDYSKLIIDNAIDGPVLVSMTNEDWKNLGITKFGDIRKCTLALQK